MAKRYWIMKAEPSEFGISDLEKQGSALWDGVRNYQVRNMFRDVMQSGDIALMYHSNTEVIGVVGEMEVLQPAEIDPTQFIPGHKYYDVKSTKDNPRWLGPEVAYVRTFPQVVTLQELKADEMFADLPFVQKGNRLSVIPISKKQYTAICTLATKTSSQKI
jgi:predicted RNA-binding protein with PUA-like domain